MAPSPILLVLGAGANVGAGLAKRFASTGYKVALVSRRGAGETKPDDGYLHIKADLSDVSVYPGIYSQVRAAFGGVPSTVVYNAASLTPPAESGNLFSVPLDGLQRDLDIAVKGAYVAAGEAYRLWTEANDGGKKVFIYTGNMTAKAHLAIPNIVTLGIGKHGAWYWLGVADKLYKEKGFR